MQCLSATATDPVNTTRSKESPKYYHPDLTECDVIRYDVITRLCCCLVQYTSQLSTHCYTRVTQNKAKLDECVSTF